VVLLLLFLAGPWLSANKILPLPNHTYSTESVKYELFPWVQKFVSEETNDVDIAFIGSSHMGWDIDTAYVQQKLDEGLGRKTTVRTASYLFPGYDALYFFTKDLLVHRRVKTIVFCDEFSQAVYSLHRNSPQWFRYEDGADELAGLPLRYRAEYYYAAMVGMPRILLASVDSNLPMDPNPQITGPLAYLHADNPENTLGSINVHLGYDATGLDRNTDFAPYTPQTKATPDNTIIYSPATASSFVFSNQPVPASEIYFAKQFALLAKNHGCNLVVLHLPFISEKNSSVIPETQNWSDLLQTDVCLMGIPGKELFSGLTEQQMEQIFLDPHHFNENGQKYFTPLITPALLKFYENHQH
jgi:hypothetical protein